MVNLILQEQQDKGRTWSMSCQDEELNPPFKPLPWGRRQAGCVPQAQHTQPTLIPQAWRAQTHPPWPLPDYSGINHTDYMLPKKEVLFSVQSWLRPPACKQQPKNAIFCLIVSLGFSGAAITLDKKTKNDCNPRQLNLQRKQGDNM